jgi:cytoskeletal protein CcmA (bactofilin family)
MPSAKPALQREPSTDAQSGFHVRELNVVPPSVPRRIAITEGLTIRAVPSPITAQPRKETSFQPRVPVITGEAHYRGVVPIDGIISGQLGATGSALAVKQRPRNISDEFQPELNGELSFKDMLRINGQVGGKVFSYKGTLIIDQSARVEAEINVAVCVINGIVNGDVMAHDRVELGPGAIIHGNISTRSIMIKPGAVFQGDCRMIKEETLS